MVFCWMDKLLNEKDLLCLGGEEEKGEDMGKRRNEELKEKDGEIKGVGKGLELEKVGCKGLWRMIDVGEERLNIGVRKKCGRKE